VVYAPVPAFLQRGADIDGVAVGNDFNTAIFVSSDGNIIACGIPDHNALTGKVQVFQYDGVTGLWNQHGADLDGDAPNGRFGFSTSLSNNGSIIAIGAYAHNAFSGLVRVFQFNGSAWTQLGLDIDGAGYSLTGRYVSLSSLVTRVAFSALYSREVRVMEYDGSAWVQV
jgi:hypothetical protein